MDLTLTPEQEEIRRTAAGFVAKEVVPRVREWDRAEAMDPAIVDALAAVGFLGAAIPERFGGMGLDNLSYCLIVEELGKADSSVRGIVSVNNGLVGKTILKWGTDEQRREWLPRLASGDALGCFGLTEPGTGSDASNLQTRAQKVDGGWRISGQKQWISLGNYAKLALVFAQTDPDKKHRGIACFLVPTLIGSAFLQPLVAQLLRGEKDANTPVTLLLNAFTLYYGVLLGFSRSRCSAITTRPRTPSAARPPASWRSTAI